MQSLFTASAKESGSWFFLTGYGGKGSYHTANDFTHYGYNYDSKYNGWMMGARWEAIANEQQKLAMKIGVSKGTLSLTPQARDGVSNGKFDTWNINSVLSWQHANGLTLDLPLGYSHFNGDVFSEMRGRVASPSAKIWHVGIEGSKAWRFNRHQIAPIAGIAWQHLKIDSFQDSDNARVSYKMHREPRYFGGVKYEYSPDLNGPLRIGGEFRLVHRPGKANQTIVGDGVHNASFDSGQGGNSSQFKAHAAVTLAKNVELSSQLQYQRRLQQEGMDDYGITGSVKVMF